MAMDFAGLAEPLAEAAPQASSPPPVQMAEGLDFSKFGAIPVEEQGLDFSKFGAVPIEDPASGSSPSKPVEPGMVAPVPAAPVGGDFGGTPPAVASREPATFDFLERSWLDYNKRNVMLETLAGRKDVPTAAIEFAKIVEQAGPACAAQKGRLTVDVDPKAGVITKITCVGMDPKGQK